MGGICDRPSPGHLHLARDGVRCIHTRPNIAEWMRKTFSINGIRGFLRNRSYGGRHSSNPRHRHRIAAVTISSNSEMLNCCKRATTRTDPVRDHRPGSQAR